MARTNALRVLKLLGIRFSFPCPSGVLPISALFFAYASRQADLIMVSHPTGGGYLAGILSGDVAEGTTMDVLSWSSLKSKRLVGSIDAAEVLAGSKAIDEEKSLKAAPSLLLQMPLPLYTVVDSHGLHMSLSTPRNSIDKSNRADVNLISFEFDVGNIDAMN